ncbi:MAG TPA: cupin domain-containing protein [Gammaproteobacteria bacterium]
MTPSDFGGLRIFDYTAGRTESSSVALIEVPPGVRHPQAWSRRSDKYYVVAAGQITFVLDGTAHVMRAGDFCLVRRGRRFSYANESDGLATLLLVHTPSFELAEEVFVEE